VLLPRVSSRPAPAASASSGAAVSERVALTLR
jgi:hypothetical protein